MLKALVRKTVGRRRIHSLQTLIRDSSIYTQEPAVTEPGAGKVVVLAPHMDDETLGCGGTIARHAQAGAEVTVIFLTDGRYGGRSCPEATRPERERLQRELIETRKQEAQLAGQILGVRSLLFLDAEDTQLRRDQHVGARLRQILQQEKPDCVYLPFFLERHVDHRAANEVLLAAVSGTALEFQCRGYEISTPLFPNCLVRIDTTLELKRQALSCYHSQLTDFDYVHAAIGLNAHRSMSLGGHCGRFAEAFHALPLREYRQFYHAVPVSLR
ncbi:MAG TPA: PIG-L family deacetylase [Steroidobacteraceae bacterium]|nr:PIG-L family deacetylase [Steroidobacteraceae bacterium]